MSPEDGQDVSVPSERAVAAAMLNEGTYRGDLATIMPVQPLECVNGFTRGAVVAVVRCAELEPVRPFWHWRYPSSNIYVRLRKSVPPPRLSFPPVKKDEEAG